MQSFSDVSLRAKLKLFPVAHITVLHDVVLALLAVLAGGLDFGGVRGGLERLVVLETGCARSNALKTRG